MKKKKKKAINKSRQPFSDIELAFLEACKHIKAEYHVKKES